MRMFLVPAAVAGLLGGAPAVAAQFVFTATGSVAMATPSTFTFNGTVYQTLEVELTGFRPAEIASGDELLFDIGLDGPFVVPSGGQFIGLNFLSTTVDDLGGQNEGTIDAFDDAVGIAAPVDVGCVNCLSTIYGRDGGPFSFTGFTGRTVVANLASPVTIDRLTLSYQVTNTAVPDAVPEPAAWATMLLGFGLTGGLIRGRRPLAAAT